MDDLLVLLIFNGTFHCLEDIKLWNGLIQGWICSEDGRFVFYIDLYLACLVGCLWWEYRRGWFHGGVQR